MKAIFLSATRRFGKSSKTGNDYDMCMISIAVPVENVTTANMTFQGFGFEAKEIDLNPLVMAQFANVKPFTEVDLVIEPTPKNFSRTWVNGLVSAK